MLLECTNELRGLGEAGVIEIEKCRLCDLDYWRGIRWKDGEDTRNGLIWMIGDLPWLDSESLELGDRGRYVGVL